MRSSAAKRSSSRSTRSSTSTGSTPSRSSCRRGRTGQASATSVFLKKSDVTTELKKPLADSIGAKTPKIGAMPKRELALVNRITEPRLYSYEYQQAQDGSAVLIYAPVVLGA